MQRTVVVLILMFVLGGLTGQEEAWKIEGLTIQNMRGDTVQEGVLGQDLLFKMDTSVYTEGNTVYFEDVAAGTLETYGKSPGWYRFALRDQLEEGRFTNIFQTFNEFEIPVQLSLGSSLNDRNLIGEFLVIIDPQQKTRRNYSLVTAGILLLLFLTVMLKGGLNFLNDPVKGDERATFSLSRTQFAYWTIIILISFFYVWIHKGDTIDVSVDLLTLLGISAGTTFGASAIDRGSSDRPSSSPGQLKKGSKTFLMDLIWAGSGPSIHRMQNVAFTIAISSYFLYGVFVEKAIPDIDAGFLTLMGISSGTYLALKSQEGKEIEHEIEG